MCLDLLGRLEGAMLSYIPQSKDRTPEYSMQSGIDMQPEPLQ